MQKNSLQNRNGVVKTLAEWEREVQIAQPEQPAEVISESQEISGQEIKKRKKK